MSNTNIERLLVALIEQSRAMATRMVGDPDRTMLCHFCSMPMPLWENILVQHLAGVPAHVICPKEALTRKLKEAGPTEDFPYEEFSSAVDARLTKKNPPAISGVIEI